MAAMPKKRRRSPSDVIERRMLRARSVMLFGPIEHGLTQETIKRLLVLDQVDSAKPIRVFVNSPGGVADDGFAIYDVMRFVSAPVYTIITGLAASAATIVAVGAPKEQRLILRHSRVMLHQPSVGARGTASDIAISAREILRLRKKANALFARETGQPEEKIEKDMHRDYWMGAEEAVEYGLVSRIVEKAADVR